MQPLNTYDHAESWLLSMTDYERMLGGGSIRYDTRTFDLHHFRDQLQLLGNPHQEYAVIHVAGTKGKGSTCAFLESALRHCGIKTGLFTSPHLSRFTERVKVNGSDIPENDFCRLIDNLRNVMIPDPEAASDGQADARSFRTVFEILTATAFSFFAEQRVDVAVIETGLGGRLDSTNVFDEQTSKPLVNVITAIGLDHTAILGETLHAIATEKAGIIRRHAGTVVSFQASPEHDLLVTEVVRKRCRAIGAAAPVIASEVVSIEAEAADHAKCYTLATLHGSSPAGASPLQSALAAGISLCPSLIGAHQAANAATAVLALVELEKAASAQPRAIFLDLPRPFPVLDPRLVKAGIENTSWPGRFETIDGDVPIVIDGAHCAISTAALANTCRQQFGDRTAVIVTGFLRDKPGYDLLGPMFRELKIARAVAVVPPTPRAVTADHICDAVHQYLDPSLVESAETVANAVVVARRYAAQHDAYVVVFGSLYLVGPATKAARASAVS